MRRIIACGLTAALVTLALAQAKEEKPSADVCAVQVREAVLRDKPSFLGKVVARLKYETLLTVEERKGDAWLRVRAVEGKQAGWLSATAVSTDPVKLRAASGHAEERAGATSRSLAGRGFGEEVEAKRRARGGDIAAGYRVLDDLLAQPAYNPDPAAVPAFVEEGGLGGGR